jgi:hypothetical protein
MEPSQDGMVSQLPPKLEILEMRPHVAKDEVEY